MIDTIFTIQAGRPLILRMTDLYIPAHASFKQYGVDEVCTECLGNVVKAIQEVAREYGVPIADTMADLNGDDLFKLMESISQARVPSISPPCYSRLVMHMQGLNHKRDYHTSKYKHIRVEGLHSFLTGLCESWLYMGDEKSESRRLG